MKKNILFQINVDANYGSNGGVARDIGQIMINNGWDSYIAYARGAEPSSSHLIKISNKVDILIHVLESRLLDNQGLGSIYETKKFINKIKEIKPDIIHLHNIHGYFLNYKILFDFLKEYNHPVIWTLHDCWPFTGHCSHFVSADCIKWKTQCNKCPLYSAYPKAFIDRSSRNYILKKKVFTSLKNMTIVTVSDWLGDLARMSFLKKYPIIVINNAIDLDIFKRSKNIDEIKKKYTINENDFILLGVATNWSKSKGLLDYYELSSKLNDNERIVLVGLNKTQIKQLPNKIIGIPRTSNLEELIGLYSVADVVLNLSYAETFGMTTIEGFACGTPCIGYNRTATPSLITQDTGFLVEPRNYKAILECIKQIKNNGKDFYRKSCELRAHIYYDKNKNYQNYLKLYNNILNVEHF